jgi:hypothetical protein
VRTGDADETTPGMDRPDEADAPQADGWAHWRRVILGDPYLVWHEGPDFAALLAAELTAAVLD